MNKYKMFIIISIIILIVSIVGSALAYFMWTSNKEALVNVTVSSGTGSCSLINDNNLEIFPTYSKYHGRKIKLNARQEMSEKAYITWTMVVNQINGLQDKTFMYELVNNTTGESYGSGTFENITSGSNIIFSHSEEVLGYNRDYEFMLYLWIDGTIGDNPIGMSDQIFDFDMNCSITGTDEGRVKEQPILGTAIFSKAGLTNDQIGSVTFVEDTPIPEDSIDVSAEQNGTVMLWHSDSDGDDLHDVYIGSSHGKVIIKTAAGLFSGLSNVTLIDLEKTNTAFLSNSAYQMFNGCSKLKTLNLNGFDTSNITNMRQMFADCSSLTSLDLSNFNTSNATNMMEMFDGCSGLITLDLSNFDTSNVTPMVQMFFNCSSMVILDISSFDTSKVTDMSSMFEGCSSLTSLNLSSFNTSSVEVMSRMFVGCSSLTSLNLSSFDTSNVGNIGNMFEGCSSLTSLDLSNFDTSKVTNMAHMFQGCRSLTSLDLSSFNTSNVISIGCMFCGCSSLTSLDLSEFNTSAVTNMDETFNRCSNLSTIYVSSLWDVSNVTNSWDLFEGCISLKGGAGTKFIGDDIRYAKIDGGVDDPGYFTLKV